METEHEFTLILEGVPDLTDEVMDALFEAGCDDGTFMMTAGRMYGAFTRTAPTMKDAIISAIRDIRKANVGARVLRVEECNLVTRSEIARKIKRSRQLVQQYIAGTRGPGGFPPPACGIADDPRAYLWRWCEVAYWLWQNGMVKEGIAQEAMDIATINSGLELATSREIDPGLYDEVIRLIDESISVR